MTTSTVAFPSGNAPFTDAEKMRELMLGDWTIAYSTLKMWREGKRLRPWYSYSRTDDPTVLYDVTQAEEVVDGSKRPITTKPARMDGTNKQDPKTPWAFRWNGTGWLRLVGMDWRVVYYDVDNGVAATCFSKTFHSEAACSVIVRDPSKHPSNDPSVVAAMAAIRSQADFGQMGPLEPAAGSRWDPKYC